MTTDPLTLARAVLDDEHAIPRSQVSRAAALLARQALEDGIRRLVGLPRGAKTRSVLVCLRYLASDDIADWAGIAWHGLSRACHHHAYELTPTPGEIRHLIDLVSDSPSSIKLLKGPSHDRLPVPAAHSAPTVGTTPEGTPLAVGRGGTARDRDHLGEHPDRR